MDRVLYCEIDKGKLYTSIMSTTFHLTLYKNSSDPMALDKTLSDPINFECALKHDCPIETPYFAVTRGDNVVLVGYNYCYVAELKRYYHCDITIGIGGTAQIACEVDPYMTFRVGIRGLNCYVERQEFIYDPYFHDDIYPIAQGSIVDAVDVGTVGTTRKIYLTCVGGNENEE